MEKQKMVEIARSFSYKLNVGNFESRDFFCSQKAEVPEDDAEYTSEALYFFCKKEVMKSVNDYLKENAPKPTKIKPTYEDARNSQDMQDKADTLGANR